MAHGSTPLQARKTSVLRPDWRAALQHGGILGLVIPLHLGLAALLFGSVAPRLSRSHAQPANHDALRIRLVTQIRRPSSARPMPGRSRQARPVSRPLALATTTPRQAAEPAPAVRLIKPSPVAEDYHPPILGDHAGMGSAPARARLPGTDIARIRGISLDDKPGLQQVVRRMAGASRCKYVRMKMEHSTNQFITAQLMDRALEADGCGPQVPHTVGEHTVEAISHQAIFGD
jgi:hypothetical protein